MNLFLSGSVILLSTFLCACAPIASLMDSTERVHFSCASSSTLGEYSGSGIQQSWTVTWYDSAGSLQSRSGIIAETDIELEKGYFTPILAQREVSDNSVVMAEVLPALGCLYPHQGRHEKGGIFITANELGGIVASVAFKAIKDAGYSRGHQIAAHCNWEKCIERVASLKEPGLLDRERFVLALLGGKVRSYDIVGQKKKAIRIEDRRFYIPRGELFIPAWYGSEAITIEEGESFSLALPSGTSYLFSPSGFLSVTIREEGSPVSFFTPYRLQD